MGMEYNWYLVKNKNDIDTIPEGQRVIKPDQLFGKRGKLWFVGVKLDTAWLRKRYAEHANKETTIDGKTDILHTFLVEPFITHTDEYYIAIKATRDADIIYFSLKWGVEVEENRENVIEIQISPIETLTIAHLEKIPEKLHPFIMQLFDAYRTYWFVYLEVNPFVVDEAGIIHCLDMVAKVDSCEE